MNSKLVIFFALFAILSGHVLCEVEEAQAEKNIKLHVFDSSSIWWIAVDPRDESFETVKIEIREASSSTWNMMQDNPSWGYFQFASTSGRGFSLPLSFRLTAVNGNTVTLNSVITSIAGGALIDTGAQYGGSPSTQAPTTPATPKPTTAPTNPPTNPPTNAPTTRPTNPPTNPPTSAPTTRPTNPPTSAPTTRPTSAPTNPPTSAPTTRPTNPPTSAPTTRPTTAPTSAPTTRPTTAPTSAPTTVPTTRPTTPPTTDLCGIVPTSAEPIQILVPLYVYPGAAWDQLVTVARSGVKVIAIINPNSGPAASGPDSSYTTYMRRLLDAGVELVGYVHTLWGDRALATVTGEIDTYASRYPGVTGIFLDEGSAEAADVTYYRNVYNHIMSKSGYRHVILNPGVQPDQQYLSISTNIVIFENYASSLASARYATWVKCAPNQAAKANYKYKFSGIVHTATLANMPSYITQMHNMGMGIVYVTDGAGGCCTYNTLASYFLQEGTSVAGLN